MTNARRKATAATVAGLLLAGVGRARAAEPIAATDPREASIVLHIVNYAALAGDVLDEAMARVVSVYKVIGVRTVWADGEAPAGHQDGRLHFTVLLLSRDMAMKKISAEGINGSVLGQAHLASRRAHIFYDRIATMPGAPVYLPIPLGDVIAHEVGHLLLRTNGHSRSGIMRANVDVHGMQLRSFDSAQARTIRTALLGPTVVATGR